MRLLPAALSFALASTALTATALADDKKIGLGGDLLFTLPLGDMADATGPQVGASIRLGYYVMPQFEGYVRAGYLMGLKKEQSTTVLNQTFTTKYGIDNIPVYIGGRYFIMQPYSGLYGNLEIGLNMMKFKAESDTGSFDSSVTRTGVNIGLGYVISEELPVNIAVQYSILNLIGKESASSTVGGTTISAEEKTQSAINFMIGYEARF